MGTSGRRVNPELGASGGQRKEEGEQATRPPFDRQPARVLVYTPDVPGRVATVVANALLGEMGRPTVNTRRIYITIVRTTVNPNFSVRPLSHRDQHHHQPRDQSNRTTPAVDIATVFAGS